MSKGGSLMAMGVTRTAVIFMVRGLKARGKVIGCDDSCSPPETQPWSSRRCAYDCGAIRRI
ncbi:protein of unknown function [Pararobbsia alpina]